MDAECSDVLPYLGAGIQGFCKDLLEVADILEKATQCVPKEEIRDDNPHLKNLYEGLVMTEVQIQKSNRDIFVCECTVFLATRRVGQSCALMECEDWDPLD